MRIFEYQRDKRGFTLLEVLVAVSVLGIAMVLIVSLFSGALGSVRVSRGYSDALLLAKEKMDEAFAQAADMDIEDGMKEEGSTGGLRWEMVYGVFDDGTETGPHLYNVKVSVMWKEGGKTKTLSLEGVLPPLVKGGSGDGEA